MLAVHQHHVLVSRIWQSATPHAWIIDLSHTHVLPPAVSLCPQHLKRQKEQT